MLKIYLARHGQDEDNAAGVLNGHRNKSLTSLGVTQAQQLANRIKSTGMTFDCVYVSPLERALTTASIITTTNGLHPAVVMNSLVERDFGIMTGRDCREAVSVCRPDVFETETVHYILAPEGAETFPQLLARAHAVLDSIVEKFRSGNVLLVAHGDIGKMIYAAYYHLTWEHVLQLFHFGNSELIELSPEKNYQDVHVFQAVQYNH